MGKGAYIEPRWIRHGDIVQDLDYIAINLIVPIPQDASIALTLTFVQHLPELYEIVIP